MPRAERLAITSKIFATIKGASPREGSSSKRSFGRPTIARASASICCSPPESVPPSWLMRVPSTGKSSQAAAMSRFSCQPSGCVKPPSSRFSRTVSRGKIRLPSGEWPMPSRMISWGFLPVIDSPRNRTAPPREGTIPEIAIKSVVLPAPLAPMIATSSPSSTSSETRSSARIGPYPASSSCTSSIGIAQASPPR